MVSNNIKKLCYDCYKELDNHEGTRCEHCRILHNKRQIKRRDLHRGKFCIECFSPISEESNGDYLVCINCRLMRDMRRI